MLNLLFNSHVSEYFDTPDTGTGTVEPELETFELLNAEDDKPEPLDLPVDKKVKEDGEDDDKKEKELSELEEIEKELEEEGKDKEEDLLELTTPVRRREILAKYPTLFKDFPYLEKAYYREQQFTELLPTIQDAKIAVEKAQILDMTERQVMSGDISNVLAAAKSESPEAFNKIADNYLPALRKVDEQAYYHVLGNVVKDTIITMVREARALGDQGAPLQAAANILNQFVFGSQNFTPPSTLSRQVNPQDQNREEQLQNQERQQVYTRFESVKDDLQVKADNTLRATIDGHIDPNGNMTDFVKRHATNEAFSNLEDLISKDGRFRSLLDKLWEKAFQSNFDKRSTDLIKSAYLSKARTLLPSVIKKARNDALKGTRRASSVNEDEVETTPRRSQLSTTNTGQSTAPSSGKFKKASDIPRGMSSLDVLMKD